MKKSPTALVLPIRASSEALATNVAQGLLDQGCAVLDVGPSGIEEVTLRLRIFGVDGGICVTASHNPMDYNGMKMVRTGSAPFEVASGLALIKELAEENGFEKSAALGNIRDVAGEARWTYVERICRSVDISALKRQKILMNAGHGTTGPTFDTIAEQLSELGFPLPFERLFHNPDGSFPQGIPNPIRPDNRPATAEAVRATDANFGVAWDGDFDRCCFFDLTLAFVGGEYVIGLLVEASASCRFSLPFSSSKAFRRWVSDTSMPPYLMGWPAPPSMRKLDWRKTGGSYEDHDNRY